MRDAHGLDRRAARDCLKYRRFRGRAARCADGTAGDAGEEPADPSLRRPMSRMLGPWHAPHGDERVTVKIRQETPMQKIILPLALFPAAALAHPGHGEDAAAHWLASWDHVAVLALAAVVAADVLRRVVVTLRRRRRAGRQE
jgi:hypothetical protein